RPRAVARGRRPPHKDAVWRWVENTISNLLHEPGIRAVVMNLRDITERKQADAERARLEQRLRPAERVDVARPPRGRHRARLHQKPGRNRGLRRDAGGDDARRLAAAALRAKRA